jgi:hypothetical protein
MANHPGYAQHSHARNGWMISHIPFRHGPQGLSAPLCTRTKRLYKPSKKKNEKNILLRKYPDTKPKKKGGNEKEKKIYLHTSTFTRSHTKGNCTPMLISGLVSMPPPSREHPLMSTKRTVTLTPLTIFHISLVPFMHLNTWRNNA